MKPTRIHCRLPRALAASLVLIYLGTGWALYGQQTPIPKQIAELLEGAEPIVPSAPGGSLKGSAEPPRALLTVGGYLRHLGAPPGCQFKVKAVVPGQPVETARAFLREHKGLFGVEHPAVEFVHLKSTSARGRNYVRLRQTFAGLPIFSAEVTVQLNTQDGVEFVLSRLATDPRAFDDAGLASPPAISSDDAIARVTTLLGSRAGNKLLITSQPSLALFAPALLNLEGKARLVWDMKVATVDFSDLNERVLLDARTGEIVRQYPLNKAALDRVIRDGNNSSDKTTVRTEGQGPCAVAQANDAYDILGDTYAFYYNVLGRDSVDNGGWTLEGTVRYCPSGDACPWRNAQWVSHWLWWGGYMEFGDGWAADDVVAHEFTHGVTEFSSDLDYENVSGALNESFSDCFGEFVDLTNGRGNDAADVRWRIGEDVPDYLGTGLRNMQNPPSMGQPDRLGSALYIPPTSDPNEGNDYGGVHHNCGVNNKLCYLLTDGDTFNGQAVYGMGITAIAQLYYEVDAHLLGSSADWADLNAALRQAAVNLGWSSANRNNLSRACSAVELPSDWRDIYVDLNNGCSVPNGQRDCGADSTGGPYTSISAALNNSFPGDHLFIRTGSYNETLTFDKIMTIKVYDGPVTVGR